MTDRAKKISELQATTSVVNTDKIVVLKDAANPSVTASTRSITIDNLTSSIRYANNTVSGVVKVGNNLTINATGYLASDGTANFIFSNNVLTIPAFAEMNTPRIANTKYAISYYDQGGQWGGYTQYDEPEGNSSWAWVGTDIGNINDPYIILEVRADDGDYTTWRFDSDLKRNGVSVIGTGQIDGGNAFTTPTAEITVDGGGA
jgi:hypothetical protein